MLRVPTDSAIPGMVLALPVLHPRRPDTILLASGLTLDRHTIDRLQEIDLREVWIQYPPLAFIGQYICPRVFEGQAALAQQIAFALDAVIAAQAQPYLNYAAYRAAISGLLDRLIARPRAAIFVQEIADRQRPLLRHSASVCMISLLMGLKLDDYIIAERSRISASAARDVAGIGLAGMLHDLGMLRLSPETVRRWETTRDESDPEWQEHVHIGFELVKDAIGPAPAAAVLHHHQKFDGSGFPSRQRIDGTEERLAGRDIHVFARIVGAASLFDQIRHPPPADAPVLPPSAAAERPIAATTDSTSGRHRNPAHRPGRGKPPESLPVVRALRMLREEPWCNWIDPMVYTAMLSVVPAYAPGSLVRLSTGQRAVVTAWHPSDPCRPTVWTIGDLREIPDRLPADSQELCLRDEPNLFIVEAEGQDVSADNFYPSWPGEFDLRLAGRTFFNRAAG